MITIVSFKSVYSFIASLILTGLLSFASTTVQNPQTPTNELNISLKKIKTISLTDEEKGIYLTKPDSFTVDGEGNFFILDPGKEAVFKFTPDGRCALSFGKKGQGPGDFMSPLAVASYAEEGIVVMDSMQKSFSFFDCNGKYVRKILLPSAEHAPAGMLVLKNGDMVIHSLAMKMEKDSLTFQYVVKRFNAKLEARAVIYRGPVYRAEESFTQHEQMEIKTALDSKGNFYLAPRSEKEYRYEVYSPDGKLLKTVRKAYTPIRKTREEIESRKQELKYLRNKYAEGENFLSKVRISPFISSIVDIAVDSRDRVLVLAAGKGKSRIDIFSPAGKYIAVISVQKRVSPVTAVKGDRLYILENDGENDPTITVYVMIESRRTTK